MSYLDNLDELKYDLKISSNYHRKRKFFYRTIDVYSKALSIVALTAIGFQSSTLTIGIAVLSGLLTVTTIVIDCSGMAGKHKELATRFMLLLSETVKSDESDLSALRQKYHLIEAEEPPALRGLAQLCQDEEDFAQGKDVDQARFSFFRRVIAQLGFGQRPIDEI